MNFKHGDNGLCPLPTDSNLVNAAREISKKYVEGNVILDRVGSGDIWNKEVDRIVMLNEKYGALCEDMESFAVFQAAKNYEVPAISVRAISNNEVLSEIYDRSLGNNSQEFTTDLIKEYLIDNKV